MSAVDGEIAGPEQSPNAGSARVARTCVLVPGMHRSGTSALARVLNLLGCDISDALLAPNEFNERGYWEDPYFLDLNERMLSSAGLSWNSWEGLNDSWYSSGKSSQFLKEATALVDKRFGASSLFVIKDPRIARLMPFWRAVLEGMDIQIKAIIPVRKPSEVALSIQHRDRINAQQGQLIWLRYTLDAEYGSRGLDRAFIAYDQLLEDWRSAMERVRAGLDRFEWPRQSSSIFNEIDRFLTPELRHHRPGEQQAIDDSPWSRDVWAIFQRWTLDLAQKGDEARLDSIRDTMTLAEGNFVRVLMEYQKYGEGLADQLSVVNTELERQRRLADALPLLQGEIAALRDVAIADQTEMKRLSGLVHEQADQIARLKVWLEASRQNSHFYRDANLGVETPDELLTTSERLMAEANEGLRP